MSHKQIECRSCGQYIVFLPTASGKSMPVDADTVEESDDGYDPKRHVSHFSTCDQPERFRKPRPQKRGLDET
jgi:hypothetical protein